MNGDNEGGVRVERTVRRHPLNLDVIRKSKKFQVGCDGWIVGLTVGDQYYENTGIQLSLDPDETTHNRLARLGYYHEPSTTSQNGRNIMDADGMRIGTMTCTEANEFCDLLDIQNTIIAIADPTDYETGGEKTVETCRQIAFECIERNHL